MGVSATDMSTIDGLRTVPAPHVPNPGRDRGDVDTPLSYVQIDERIMR
jgi:hypothetical protein